MSYFLDFSGPIFDYFKDNWGRLEDEFYNHILTQKSRNKPKYIRNNGQILYSGSIDIMSIKLAYSLLDIHERRISGWSEDEGPYRYVFPKRYPDAWKEAVSWKKLLEDYDEYIEQLFFNIAHPGANLSYHYGVSKHCWRVHITIQENQGFTFNIEGERRKWVRGICNSFKFDDGNLWHGVDWEESGSPQQRIVCIMDIKKDGIQT